MDRNKFPGKVVFIRRDNQFELTPEKFKALGEDQREYLTKQMSPDEIRIHSVVSRTGIYGVVDEFNNGISPDEWFCGIMD